MHFEDTPIWLEVEDIINRKTQLRLYEYKVTIHTEVEDFGVWDMNDLENTRNYAADITEKTKLLFKIGLGDYVRRLYPYRNNLEITVRRVPQVGIGGKNAEDQKARVIRYKAIFNPAKNPGVAGSELENQHFNDLNNGDIAEIELELVDRGMEPLRIATTGGAFMKKTPEAIIRGLLGGESLRVLVDGRPSIDGLVLEPPDNTTPIANLIVPDGKRISSIPTMLQELICGVYNGGIGTFFQRYNEQRYWFVAPLYNYLRFDKPGKKVIFYSVPQDKLPQIDNSYQVEGDILKVVVTAQRKYTDTADLGYMNGGSGYRFADARAFMRKPVKITEEGIIGMRANLNHEVAIVDRKDGLNYAPVDPVGPSSNPYARRSEVIMRQMAQVDLVWENADPELIFPYMPCQFVTMSNGKVISLRGTILFLHDFTARVEKYSASAFRVNCRITIACEPKSDLPGIPEQGVSTDE